MPASESYTRHAHWCEIAGGREQLRRIEGEAEGVASERDRGGRELCLHREISKDNLNTSVKWRSAVQWCCGWRDAHVSVECRRVDEEVWKMAVFSVRNKRISKEDTLYILLIFLFLIIIWLDNQVVHNIYIFPTHVIFKDANVDCKIAFCNESSWNRKQQRIAD